MQNALLYEETVEDLRRVEDFARRRRLELIVTAAAALENAGDMESPASAPIPAAAAAQLVWDNVSPGQRSQEVLQTLPGDESLAMTPTEMSAHMAPTEDGQRLSKGSVRASILNIRRVEKRLREEGRIVGRVLQADWYDRDGSNRYWLRPEDKAVITAL